MAWQAAGGHRRPWQASQQAIVCDAGGGVEDASVASGRKPSDKAGKPNGKPWQAMASVASHGKRRKPYQAVFSSLVAKYESSDLNLRRGFAAS